MTHQKQNIGLKKQDPIIGNKKEEDRIGSRTAKQKTGSAAQNESKVDWLKLHTEKPKATVDLIIIIPNTRAVQELIS